MLLINENRENTSRNYKSSLPSNYEAQGCRNNFVSLTSFKGGLLGLRMGAAASSIPTPAGQTEEDSLPPPAPLPAERTLPSGSPGQVSLPTFHTEATLPPSSQRRNQDRQKAGRGDPAKGVCLLSIHSPHGVQCPPECLALRPKRGPSHSEARKLGWKPPGWPLILGSL